VEEGKEGQLLQQRREQKVEAQRVERVVGAMVSL